MEVTFEAILSSFEPEEKDEDKYQGTDLFCNRDNCDFGFNGDKY